MEITNITFESLSARLSKIAAAESITRHELGELSREVLAFVVATEDVRIINTLLGKGEDGKLTLTAQNRKAASFYFREFCPFSDNGANIDKGEVLVFIKKKAKVWEKLVAKIETWLSVETNNVWTWAQDNLTTEVKPANYTGKLSKLVASALNDETEGLTGAEVMSAVLAGGVSITDLMAVVESIMNQEKEAA